MNISDFTPFSFRAGNWLFQPTRNAASILAGHGIKIDSSVFKGGLQHKYRLDYRDAENNGYYWRFEDNVTRATPAGPLLEIPIFSKMVPSWKFLTGKRLRLQHKAASKPPTLNDQFHRICDRFRLRHPLKFDFCRMTLTELLTMLGDVLREDRANPDTFKPIVLIGHTKDLADFATVKQFVAFLQKSGVGISTLENAYNRLQADVVATTH